MSNATGQGANVDLSRAQTDFPPQGHRFALDGAIEAPLRLCYRFDGEAPDLSLRLRLQLECSEEGDLGSEEILSIRKSWVPAIGHGKVAVHAEAVTLYHSGRTSGGTGSAADDLHTIRGTIEGESIGGSSPGSHRPVIPADVLLKSQTLRQHPVHE